MNLDAILLCVRMSIKSLVRGLRCVHRNLDVMVGRGINDPDLLVLWLSPLRIGNVVLKVGIVVIYLFNVCSLLG